MKSLSAGTRIRFAWNPANNCPASPPRGSPRAIPMHLGTVLKPPNGDPYHILVCSDENPYKKRCTGACPDFVGHPDLGVLLNHREHWYEVCKDQRSASILEPIPDHIAVHVKESFYHDDVLFPIGSFGKLISRSQDGTLALVNWNIDSWLSSTTLHETQNKKAPFYKRSSEFIPGKTFLNCFQVPASRLSWIRIQKGRNILTLGSLAKDTTPYQVGDYLIYTGDNEVPAQPVFLSPYIHRYHIQKGAILKIVSSPGSNTVRCKVMAAAPPLLIGARVEVRITHIKTYEKEIIEAGNTVEIVGSVIFKNKELKGLQGHVLLPEDNEGDVGIEFSKDIGAGSLDGVGTDKRCLYVNKNALKKQ